MASEFKKISNASTTHGMGQPGHGGTHGTKTKGSIAGQTLVLQAAGAAQAAMQAQNLDGPALATAPSRSVAQRRVAVEAAFRPLPPADILTRAHREDLASVRRGSLSLLRGDKSAGGKAQVSKSRLLSLELAAAALQDDVSAEAATAMLAPVRQQAHTPRDLAQQLNALRNDEEALQHFQEDLLAAFDSPEELRKLFEDLKRGEVGEEELMKRLARVMGIQALLGDPESRKVLRQEIQDQIAELKSDGQGEGRRVFAMVKAAPVTIGTDDPDAFEKLYADVVTVPVQEPTPVHAILKMIVSRFGFDKIPSVTENLQKALAHDLTSATPSHETWLNAVITDQGTTFVLRSLHGMVTDLCAHLGRTGHAHA